MKKLLIFLILFGLFCGCSTHIYIPFTSFKYPIENTDKIFNPCISLKHPDEIDLKIIPVTTGNKWVFEKNGFAGSGTITYIIGELDTVYFNDNEGKKSAQGFRIFCLEEPERIAYYLKCDSAAVIAIAKDSINKVLISGMTIYENPVIGTKDPYYKDMA